MAVGGRALTPPALRAAAAVLRGGGVVIFPTETFYGIMADPARHGAIRRLLDAKGRAADKAVPLLLSAVRAAALLPAAAAPLQRLCAAFWPGPLTVALPPPLGAAAAPRAADGSIGLRLSGLAAARALAAAAGGLLTATSANLAGAPPARSVAELAPALVARVDLVIDGGTLAGGLPSTVVALRGGHVTVLRPGAIAIAALEAALGAAVQVA